MAKNTSGMNRKYQDKTFDSQDWQLVNKKTGETKDQKGVIYMERTLTDKVTFNSKSYYYLDIDRLKVLQSNGITDVELGLLIHITSNLSPYKNACMQANNKYHTTASISKVINQSEQSVKRKLNRLVELGALANQKIPGRKTGKRVYFVNPYFIRRGKEFHDFLGVLFNDIILSDKTNESLKKTIGDKQ